MNYVTIIIVVVLVLLSGLFSGLTLGLLGLDKSEVERKAKLGDKRARKVYSVRKKGNLLLCTLLLGNVGVNSVLAIFLGSIATGVVAVIVSTGLIVIFGEIIPQATISRYALAVGSKTTWIVKFFMIILFPICWPIAKGLDLILGEEMPTIWSRNELEEIIKLHQQSKHSSIDADEQRIVLGALSFSNKSAKDVLTPRKVVFSLEENTLLDDRTLEKIKRLGFTRIPIYKKELDKIIGILYVKDLVGIKKGKKAKDFCKKRKLIKIKEEKKLDVLLNIFIKKKIHLVIVENKYGEFQGIVSLEDVIEEILRVEIVDELDKIKNLQKRAKSKK